VRERTADWLQLPIHSRGREWEWGVLAGSFAGGEFRATAFETSARGRDPDWSCFCPVAGRLEAPPNSPAGVMRSDCGRRGAGRMQQFGAFNAECAERGVDGAGC
jgi:hypothetical protein